MTDPTVFDLALYFYNAEAGKVTACWVREAVYSQQRVTFDPSWKDAIFAQHEVAAGSPRSLAYVFNPSLLIGPGQPPIPPRAFVGGAPAVSAPGDRDLVIIKHDDPTIAYLVTKEKYHDPEVCHPIDRGDPNASDLEVLALNAGVIAANLPKSPAGAGWTCYLLNLLSLKSAAVPNASVADKAQYWTDATSQPANQRS